VFCSCGSPERRMNHSRSSFHWSDSCHKTVRTPPPEDRVDNCEFPQSGFLCRPRDQDRPSTDEYIMYGCFFSSDAFSLDAFIRQHLGRSKPCQPCLITLIRSDQLNTAISRIPQPEFMLINWVRIRSFMSRPTQESPTFDSAAVV
jgi:hypothetical protein